MSDSTSGAAAPGVQLVAAYATGYPASRRVFISHPNLRHVLITQRDELVWANVIDVENGAADAAFAVRWARWMRTAHKMALPTVYVSRSGRGAVEDEFRLAGEPFPLFWIADWSAPPHAYLSLGTPVAGSVVAHQYDSLGTWDLSAVVDYWPGVDPDPSPDPVATLMRGGVVATFDDLYTLIGELRTDLDRTLATIEIHAQTIDKSIQDLSTYIQEHLK